MAGTAFPQVQGEEIEAVAEEQPQPEAPKRLMNVEIKDNLLSVELAGAEFGAVMNTIAQKAGFTVGVGGDVYSRKLTTKFSNLELERGILRLLTLVREKNYLMRYDAKGILSKVEIYGGGAPVASTLRPQTPVRRFQRSPVPSVPVPSAVPPTGTRRRLLPSQLRQRSLPQGQQQGQPPAPVTPPSEEISEEDNAEE